MACRAVMTQLRHLMVLVADIMLREINVQMAVGVNILNVCLSNNFACPLFLGELFSCIENCRMSAMWLDCLNFH
jgi:hypothetical protein